MENGRSLQDMHAERSNSSRLESSRISSAAFLTPSAEAHHDNVRDTGLQQELSTQPAVSPGVRTDERRLGSSSFEATVGVQSDCDDRHASSREAIDSNESMSSGFLGYEATSSSDVRSQMQAIYSPIAKPLFEVEELIHRELTSPHADVAKVLAHGTQLGGKRLRPAICLLAGQAIGPITPEHIVTGAVVELVHTATLVHDDVIDRSEKRRHVETINHAFGNDTSILLGDFLFARSYKLAATLRTTEVARAIAEAAEWVCEGELRQVLSRNCWDLDEQAYFEMLSGKTGQLCRVAASLGAKLSGGGNNEVDALDQYGDALGIAFQIADDYLDYFGNESSIGKTLGTDLAEGKWTLPLIRAYQMADRDGKKELENLSHLDTQERLRVAQYWIQQSDAKHYTMKVANRFRDVAIRSLEVLSESVAKSNLRRLADFSVCRAF